MINVFKELFEYKNNLTVSGLSNSLINEYVLNYYNNNDNDLLVVADSLYDANKIYKSIHKICDDVYFFPMDEFATVLAISSSPDLKIIRIDTLNQLKKAKKIIVTNLSGYLKYVDKKTESIKVDFNTKREELINFLENNSYVKTNLVTTTGEYAVRSFIVDLYPLNCDNPIRIEFFGNDIESIRFFDSETQISNQNINEISIYSFNDKTSEDKENIVDKLYNPFVFFLDYKKIKTSYDSFLDSKNEFEITIDRDIFNSFEKINVEKQIFINTLDDVAVLNDIKKYQSKEILNFNNSFDNLEEYVKSVIKDNIVIFMLTNENLINKLISVFGNDISFNTRIKDRVNIIKRDIDEGFIFNNYIVISQYDIESVKKQSVFINRYNIGRKIKGF